jgi:hypothetical protein
MVAARNPLRTALDREGLVKSYSDEEDRRKLIARLIGKSCATGRKAFR